jgi:hypothetical protein
MKKILSMVVVIVALLGFQSAKAQLLAAKSPNRSDGHVPPPKPPHPPHPPHPHDPKPGNGPKQENSPLWGNNDNSGTVPFENLKSPTTQKITTPVQQTTVQWPATPPAPKTAPKTAAKK